MVLINILLRSRVLTGMALLLASYQAKALDPMYVKLSDSARFTPTLQLSESYDDNIKGVDKGAKGSWITSIVPSFSLHAEGRKSAYMVTYRAISDVFHQSHKDNNTDHFLDAKLGMDFDRRNRLILNAGWQDVEDTDVGEGQTQNDRYTLGRVGGNYTYGAKTARMQLVMGANFETLRYQNSEDLNAEKERDSTNGRGTLFYRITPKTRVIGELRRSHFDYVSYSARTSNNTSGLVGLEWEATARTSGTVKVGREWKEYTNADVDTKSAQTWEAGINYEPTTYSTFHFTSRSALDEGDEGTASAVKTRNYRVAWEHKWRERISSEISYDWSTNDYQDYPRSDDRSTLGVGLTYKLRRWLDLSFRYRRLENDSTMEEESYKRNIFTFSVTGSL